MTRTYGISKEHGIMVLHRSPKSQNAGSIPAALENKTTEMNKIKVVQ